MHQRLRRVLAALVTALAITTLTTQVSAPASAAPGDSCSEPRISGNVSTRYVRGVGQQYDVSSAGAATGNCSSNPMTEYRYELLVYTDFDNFDEVASTSMSPTYGYVNGQLTRTGTSVAFPNAMLDRVDQYDDLRLTVQVFSRSKVWANSQWEQSAVYFYRFGSTTGSYDTATMQAYSPFACHPGPGVGKVPCG